MTGKKLKEFAAKIEDDTIVEVREGKDSPWCRTFTLHAIAPKPKKVNRCMEEDAA